MGVDRIIPSESLRRSSDSSNFAREHLVMDGPPRDAEFPTLGQYTSAVAREFSGCFLPLKPWVDQVTKSDEKPAGWKILDAIGCHGGAAP